MAETSASISSLTKTLRTFFKKHGRAHLPWRSTRDPYRILVSEIMLQQTQVDRVVAFYEKFLKAFPDTKALSRAPLPKVLRLWQGLGYNRRAKLLRDAAITIEKEFGGIFPRTAEALEQLPGVGPYTARAVSAFAFNNPEVFIETNIRSVFLHHISHVGHTMSHMGKKVDDKELLPLIAEALKRSHMEPRDFYAALMDYGSHLKKSGVRNNIQSKHYVRQSKFEGSRRQLRGAILKSLLHKPKTLQEITIYHNPFTPEQIQEELERLQKENLITLCRRKFEIAK